ncbi:OmpA family protein [Antarcticirhabdus aurantiaca]|uniref:OmpA family protein n=1 Tax=Antarcticirhabdus aurantiaca TaxID=2606717 RepID=A0ACD4NSM6_9HYPH|nr:OmpA family protein [Antarcticirhabdus aurantiaca]WAJ29797.1 OmpA family protein [Jeongeuplla avenae]
MRRAAALLPLLLLAPPAGAYTTNAPPGELPERANFNAPRIAFNAPRITFNRPSITFNAPHVTFNAERLTDEEKAFAPKSAPAPAPPEPEPLAEGLAVTEEAGGVRYTLSADILFDFDAATLRPKAREALAALSADARRRFPSATFLVEGHTDAKGSDAYNQALSERRAESVKAFLTDAESFSAADIETTGLGESRPAAPNETASGGDDPEGRQKNRRVEILVRPAS